MVPPRPTFIDNMQGEANNLTLKQDDQKDFEEENVLNPAQIFLRKNYALGKKLKCSTLLVSQMAWAS